MTSHKKFQNFLLQMFTSFEGEERERGGGEGMAKQRLDSFLNFVL